MRLWLRILCLALIVCGALGPVVAQAQTPTPPTPQLDVVLLIDSSESTKTSDRDKLRVGAAYYLLDYLQAVGETQGISHRFAVAEFNNGLIYTQTLQILQGDVSRESLKGSRETLSVPAAAVGVDASPRSLRCGLDALESPAQSETGAFVFETRHRGEAQMNIGEPIREIEVEPLLYPSALPEAPAEGVPVSTPEAEPAGSPR